MPPDGCGARSTAGARVRRSTRCRRQRRHRLALALRALDARVDGNTYRVIAEVLFGARRIPERAWKTHDLRNRTIRLVQAGFALMRGGYRALLRQSRRKK